MKKASILVLSLLVIQCYSLPTNKHRRDTDATSIGVPSEASVPATEDDSEVLEIAEKFKEEHNAKHMPMVYYGKPSSSVYAREGKLPSEVSDSAPKDVPEVTVTTEQEEEHSEKRVPSVQYSRQRRDAGEPHGVTSEAPSAEPTEVSLESAVKSKTDVLSAADQVKEEHKTINVDEGKGIISTQDKYEQKSPPEARPEASVAERTENVKYDGAAEPVPEPKISDEKPVEQSLTYKSTAAESPKYDSPVVDSPKYESPVVQSPKSKIPASASPKHESPAVEKPIIKYKKPIESNKVINDSDSDGELRTALIDPEDELRSALGDGNDNNSIFGSILDMINMVRQAITSWEQARRMLHSFAVFTGVCEAP